MVYSSQAGIIVPHIQKIKKQLAFAVAAIFMTSLAAMTLGANAAPIGDTNGCTFNTSGNTYTLQNSCVSTKQIDVPAGATLDGGGHTISPAFAKIDGANNAALGVIVADGVTIQNLTIDGSNMAAVDLHGINVFESTNVAIKNVTVLESDRGGIVVNGSEVSVSEVITSGNGWYGINVDKTGAVLNITGTMRQTDNAQIYVDNTTIGKVNDVLNQYDITSPVKSSNDALYTLKMVLGSKDECKKGGWATSENPVFKNQGQCVSHFVNKKV